MAYGDVCPCGAAAGTCGCQHSLDEDCMNCALCGECGESLDDADLCGLCRSTSEAISAEMTHV